MTLKEALIKSLPNAGRLWNQDGTPALDHKGGQIRFVGCEWDNPPAGIKPHVVGVQTSEEAIDDTVADFERQVRNCKVLGTDYHYSHLIIGRDRYRFDPTTLTCTWVEELPVGY